MWSNVIQIHQLLIEIFSKIWIFMTHQSIGSQKFELIMTSPQGKQDSNVAGGLHVIACYSTLQAIDLLALWGEVIDIL